MEDIELEIPSPPNTGDDNTVVFLEVWKEVIYPEMDIYKNGNVGGEIERTSEDEFLLRTRWRLRAVPNIDFITYPSGMLDPNVTVLANQEEETTIDYESTDEDYLYQAESEELDVYNDTVYATPLLQIKREAGEDYLEITNVGLINGNLSIYNHSHQHHAGERDELSPEDINAIPTSEIGVPNGVAPLDEDGEIASNFIDSDFQSGVEEIEQELQSGFEEIEQELTDHKENTNNPHQVTANQIGSVPTGRRIDAGTGISGGGSLTSDRNISLDVNYTDGRYTRSGTFTDHTENTNNPHEVNKSHVGLGNVPNVDLSNQVDGKVNKSGDTMEGILTAENNEDYETKQVRNITISQNDPSGGSHGDIWIKY